MNVTAPNSGPLGQPRGVGFAIVMTLITLGIYAIYWTYKTYNELKDHRGDGVNGWIGILFALFLVGYFILPSYVGRMYRDDGDSNPPISGWSGLWVLVPYVGGLIWLYKVQSSLNDYWRRKGAAA